MIIRQQIKFEFAHPDNDDWSGTYTAEFTVSWDRNKPDVDQTEVGQVWDPVGSTVDGLLFEVVMDHIEDHLEEILDGIEPPNHGEQLS
jgi:hypothetical protein